MDKTRNIWGVDEDGIIRLRFPVGGLDACMESFPYRSRESVRGRAKRLGVKGPGRRKNQKEAGTYKACADCKHEKDLSCFYAIRATGGHQAYCIECSAARTSKRWRESPAGKLAADRKKSQALRLESRRKSEQARAERERPHLSAMADRAFRFSERPTKKHEKAETIEQFRERGGEIKRLPRGATSRPLERISP